MKAVLFAFVAFAAVSFVSCGNSTSGPSKNDSTVVDTLDSVNIDSIDSIVADSTVCPD